MPLPWKEEEHTFPRYVILDENMNVLAKPENDEEALRMTIQLTIREKIPVEVYERTGFSKWVSNQPGYGKTQRG